jgi:hypothetical protein
MSNAKRKFENETKTRINIIGLNNSEKNYLKRMMIKQGVFDKIDYMNDNGFYVFPTEILCSSIRKEITSVYLDFKKEEEIIKELKENILKSIYEASINIENIENNKEKLVKEFKGYYIHSLSNFYELSLNKFFEEDNLEDLFKLVNFEGILKELKRADYINDQEVLDNKDELIWEGYFKEFEISFKEQYKKWKKRIFQYYNDQEEGYEYTNENIEGNHKYSNENFYKLCEILYGSKSSCALMIERAYIETPASRAQYSGNVYIYYAKDNLYKSMAKSIEKRISEDYKEIFMILAKNNKELDYFFNFKESINKVTLSRRIFCILNKGNSDENQLVNEECKISSANNGENFIDIFKFNIAIKMGISADKIIVTENFYDIDGNTLEVLETSNDLFCLLTKMKEESEEIGKTIKIKASNKEKIINISLNQERMSVQALVGMLYERYNGYLVDLWNRAIEGEKINKDEKKYYYSEIRTIIRNRKDDYRGYKHIGHENTNKKQENVIDFSLRSGDYNDSKRILKMLVNYGYHTVGFNSNESKIIVSVNGEISPEDQQKLINSIKGRLEESAINYFESAFLGHVSKNKFNHNNLYKALESEKNITIDDFYSAFKEIFRRMSENILRYEVSLR